MRFVSLRYRLTNEDPDLFSYLLYCRSGEGGGMLAHNLVLAASDLIHDGEWHTSTTTLHPFGEIGTMALRFRALEGKEGRLETAYLRFSSEPPRNPLKEVLDWTPGEGSVATRPLPLDAARKSPLPEFRAFPFSPAPRSAARIGRPGGRTLSLASTLLPPVLESGILGGTAAWML